MEILLEKVGILNLKYNKLRDENEFNIFTLLRKYDDEVNLHSRFIYELLNPKGSHRRNTEFLEALLEIVEIKNFDTNKVNVYKESGNIDVLITNENQAIIIENKIWAEDQNKQLERYYNKIKKQGYDEIWLIYLTINEDFPSKKSLGKLSDDVIEDFLITISYSFHISEWLEKSIEKSSRLPTLRETIIQYNNLIQEITGKSMSKDQRKEVYELLANQDNIHKAATIASNWIHVRWHLEWDFWTDFEKIISEEYEILPIQKYSKSSLDSVIHKSRNRNPWYGIMIEIASFEDDKICLFIERGWSDLYYGITVLNDKKRDKKKHDEYSEFSRKLNGFTEWEKEHVWLGGNYLSPNINFGAFTGEETLNLIKDDYREQYLKRNWKEIKSFIEKVKKMKAAPNNA